MWIRTPFATSLSRKIEGSYKLLGIHKFSKEMKTIDEMRIGNSCAIRQNLKKKKKQVAKQSSGSQEQKPK